MALLEWLDNYMFTVDLIKKCFPHKEAILYNLDVAIELAFGAEKLAEDERIDILCSVHAALCAKDIPRAAKEARAAGYNLMAAAIEYHYREQK